HIFPAISIAGALRAADPSAEILFVGAEGKMEMEKVPAAGYRIIGLPVAGFSRRITLYNFIVVYKLIISLLKARRIIREFKPDVVVGVGGYASGPLLRMAARAGIPYLVQEQNSYPGITNRLLAGKASVICVAWDGLEKYFPAARIIKTGNPVRHSFTNPGLKRDEAVDFFGLSGNGKIVLVLGGSQGSGTINTTMLASLDELQNSGVQLIWQTGSYYYDMIRSEAGDNINGVVITPFIDRMELAYAAADIIVSRAGAGTISELAIVGKPVILVPSPNVAEDHQTKNAMALSKNGAALMIPDRDASVRLCSTIKNLVADETLADTLGVNISEMAVYDSGKRIAEEIIKLGGSGERRSE
ncbi:MAG: undecaprenyldiphospho-muramoylpentapeptide beta-N-acetylglucosaminyltransferase, partial [Bacteroidales bacterium]|nr:undecaprenyldiphospho-muramoylpentapeptide beta-N-acetylglucosaminyltransferase [Bacteroidales bacterium]